MARILGNISITVNESMTSDELSEELTMWNIKQIRFQQTYHTCWSAWIEMIETCLNEEDEDDNYINNSFMSPEHHFKKLSSDVIYLIRDDIHNISSAEFIKDSQSWRLKRQVKLFNINEVLDVLIGQYFQYYNNLIQIALFKRNSINYFAKNIKWNLIETQKYNEHKKYFANNIKWELIMVQLHPRNFKKFKDWKLIDDYE